MFFTYLQGWPKRNVTGLENAKLRITVDAELPSGDPYEPDVYTVPLATVAYDNAAHMTICYPGFHQGKFGGPLRPGLNEIVTDYWFPGMFMLAGQYTFKIEAFLPAEAGAKEDKYLFAFQLSQRMAGKRSPW